MTERLPSLIVRADAAINHGVGHVMRSFALASGWVARGGSATFITTGVPRNLKEKLRAVGATLIEISHSYPDAVDLTSTLNCIASAGRNRPRPWVLLDGYHFDDRYHDRIRAVGCGLLIVDDNAHLPFYNADVVLNPGIQSQYLDYRCDRSCTLLKGTRYALLRTEFASALAMEKGTTHTARKILVTLGGSDPSNASEKVIRAVATRDLECELRVVVGPLNPHLGSLRAAASEVGPFISVEASVDDLVSQMLWADLVVTAAGGTCWELAALGLPMITVIVATNQVMIGAELERSGAAVCLGWEHSASVSRIADAICELARAPLRREQMKRAGKALVDGKGVERVIETIVQKEISRAA